MTLLSTITDVPALSLQKRVIVLLAQWRRSANSWVATIRAYRERQAALHALHEFDDYQLKDIGLYRGQLDHVVNEASHPRTRAGLRRR